MELSEEGKKILEEDRTAQRNRYLYNLSGFGFVSIFYEQTFFMDWMSKLILDTERDNIEARSDEVDGSYLSPMDIVLVMSLLDVLRGVNYDEESKKKKGGMAKVLLPFETEFLKKFCIRENIGLGELIKKTIANREPINTSLLGLEIKKLLMMVSIYTDTSTSMLTRLNPRFWDIGLKSSGDFKTTPVASLLKVLGETYFPKESDVWKILRGTPEISGIDDTWKKINLTDKTDPDEVRDIIVSQCVEFILEVGKKIQDVFLRIYIRLLDIALAKCLPTETDVVEGSVGLYAPGSQLFPEHSMRALTIVNTPEKQAPEIRRKIVDECIIPILKHSTSVFKNDQKIGGVSNSWIVGNIHAAVERCKNEIQRDDPVHGMTYTWIMRESIGKVYGELLRLLREVTDTFTFLKKVKDVEKEFEDVFRAIRNMLEVYKPKEGLMKRLAKFVIRTRKSGLDSIVKDLYPHEGTGNLLQTVSAYELTTPIRYDPEYNGADEYVLERGSISVDFEKLLVKLYGTRAKILVIPNFGVPSERNPQLVNSIEEWRSSDDTIYEHVFVIGTYKDQGCQLAYFRKILVKDVYRQTEACIIQTSGLAEDTSHVAELFKKTIDLYDFTRDITTWDLTGLLGVVLGDARKTHSLIYITWLIDYFITGFTKEQLRSFVKLLGENRFSDWIVKNYYRDVIAPTLEVLHMLG